MPGCGARCRRTFNRFLCGKLSVKAGVEKQSAETGQRKSVGRNRITGLGFRNLNNENRAVRVCNGYRKKRNCRSCRAGGQGGKASGLEDPVLRRRVVRSAVVRSVNADIFRLRLFDGGPLRRKQPENRRFRVAASADRSDATNRGSGGYLRECRG